MFQWCLMFFTGFLTCFIQTLFFDLHVFCMFLIGPLFHLQVFFTSFRTGSLFSFACFFFTYFIQAPFLHSHVFYMFHVGPLFSFTCFLHVSYRSAFIHLHVFYMFHTGPHFFIYMFLTCPLFPFTWFLQGFKRSISRPCVAFSRIVYTFLQG